MAFKYPDYELVLSLQIKRTHKKVNPVFPVVLSLEAKGLIERLEMK